MRATALAACAALLASLALFSSAHAQFAHDRSFIVDIEFLDAYFGTPIEKIEVNPGDENVPFTVVMANVGTEDITAIRGTLMLPGGFSPTDGSGPLIEADADSNAQTGELFSLTFFVNLADNAQIGQYPGAVNVEYVRILESGTRLSNFTFNFKVTGNSVINVNAASPFLTSLQNNDIAIEISNDGTAPISGVDVQMVNTQSAMSAQAESPTNVERVVIIDTDWNVGHIEPGSAKLLTGTVYIPGSVLSETLRLPLEITYFNAHGDRQTVNRIVDFYITGMIDTRIYNVGVLELSGQPTIIGEIINEGNEDALFGFVTIEPLGDSNILAATQFIDEIDTDSPVPFNIPLTFDGEPQYGEHEITVTARYKDSLREEYFVSHDAVVVIPEPPPPPRSAFDLNLPEVIPLAIAGAVIIAGISVGVYLARRRKSVAEASA